MAGVALDREQTAIPHILLFVSGGLALVYEVLWIRKFTSLFGAATPALAATLAAVFFGWTVGSAVLGRYAARVQNPLLFYGVMEIATAVGAIAVEPITGLYGRIYPSLFHASAGSPLYCVIVKTALAIAAVFLPCFCMGGTVPVLSQLFHGCQRQLGIAGGGLYAANTLGATFGALSVPFFWLPMLGADSSYRACVIISLLVGGLACWLGGREGNRSERESPTRPELVRPTGRVWRPALLFIWGLRFILKRVGAIIRARPTSKSQIANRKSQIHARFNERGAEGQPGEGSLYFRARSTWPLAVMAGLSGFVTFVLEVLWGRMFAQVHENSIYSFAVVLAVFLFGLSGGAILVRCLLRRGWAGEKLVPFAWLASGTAVLASPFLFYSLTNGLAYLKGGGGWASSGAQIFWLSIPTVLLPALFGGMVLPLLMELAGERSAESSGPVLGSLLTLNTAGSIAGALAAAFLFPAWLGLWSSVVACGAAMCLAGGWSLRMCGENEFPRLGSAELSRAKTTTETKRAKSYSRVGIGRTAGWVVCIMAMLIPVFLSPARLPRTRVATETGERLISLKEGSMGIVAVVEADGSRRIKLDNYYVLGGTASTGDERMQGHLPLLLHPNPKRVAFLGLGTGITASAASFHPVEQIVAIEIVPEVVQAARDHFGEANQRILAAPSVDVIKEDARIVLRTTEHKFDVIVGDLVVPWRKGESALLTQEHFASARRALAPGGLFCQWLPMFQLSEAEFNIAAATFVSVFPQTTVWRGDFAPDRPALALVGHTDSAPLDPAVVGRNLGLMRRDPANPHLAHEAGLWIYLIGALDPASPRFQQAKLNRETQPWIELIGPMAHAGSSSGEDALFVGARLEKYVEELRDTAAQAPQFRNLGRDQLSWRDAGTGIAHATALMAEGKQEGGSRMRQAVNRLPREIQPAFLGN